MKTFKEDEESEKNKWLKDMLVKKIVKKDEIYLSISKYLIKDNLSFYNKSIMN